MAKQKEQVAKTFEQKQPILERKLSMSKDGSWFIIKTIRTDIVHANYLQKVISKGE